MDNLSEHKMVLFDIRLLYKVIGIFFLFLPKGNTSCFIHFPLSDYKQQKPKSGFLWNMFLCGESRASKGLKSTNVPLCFNQELKWFIKKAWEFQVWYTGYLLMSRRLICPFMWPYLVISLVHHMCYTKTTAGYLYKVVFTEENTHQRHVMFLPIESHESV